MGEYIKTAVERSAGADFPDFARLHHRAGLGAVGNAEDMNYMRSDGREVRPPPTISQLSLELFVFKKRNGVDINSRCWRSNLAILILNSI